MSCAFTISAPIGADVFVAKTFSASAGTGTQLSSASFDASATANGRLGIALGGSVASLGVALTSASPLECSGTLAIPIRVTARTAAGAVIVGAYAQTVALSDSDTSGATHLSASSLTSSSTAITANYNGFVIANSIFSASASGATKGSATLTPTPLLYTTNYGSINIFASTASGNATPLRMITGSKTGIVGYPNNVTHDAQCNVYVSISNSTTNAIYVFANGANGNAAPIATISGNKTLLNGPTQMAVNSSGELFVGNTGGFNILGFPHGSNGNVAPNVNLSTNSACGGNGNGLSGNYGLALDGTGAVYADSENNNCVFVFRAGATGSQTPIRTIGGALTHMAATYGPYDIAIGPGNKLYVVVYGATTKQWLVFASGANGNVAPSQAINQPQGIYGVAVDPNGLIYVPTGNAVDVYAANATGNATPIRTITGSNTKFFEVLHISI
ncbi:MAG: hypothetical protein JO165_03965 [Candidatus Eremiobacteraeota bacterium]|nr:hypothetical protein [Candidatus Eremiobacteraeota bacterium]